MWDDWGREDIEEYIVSLAQYLRARIVDIWGPDSLSFPFTRDPDPVAQVGLTSFNPFSPGFDYNAALTAGDSMTQKATSAAAVAMLKDEYGIVVRNNSVPHTLRSDPTQNAGQGTFSSPLRISTHLFHSFKDVDRVIDALQEVVPTP
jgi:selenocysteine lyase/cysteine desulfurase